MPESTMHQCPCDKATKCKMDEPCLGCETYSQWEYKQEQHKKTMKWINK